MNNLLLFLFIILSLDCIFDVLFSRTEKRIWTTLSGKDIQDEEYEKKRGLCHSCRTNLLRAIRIEIISFRPNPSRYGQKGFGRNEIGSLDTACIFA